MVRKASMSINQYMRTVDIEAFKQASQRFNCIIMLRRLNPASLPYVGMRGYMPKSIFCKAKTATYNVNVPGYVQRSMVAGLVVDPTMPGMGAAFSNTSNAKEMWAEFLKKLGVKSLNVIDLYEKLPVERGGFYTVQNEAAKPHYGALMFCPFIPSDVQQFKLSTFYMQNSFFIHGDYDLYGLIPADERENREMNIGQLFGQANFYTPLLEPVQNFINQYIGTPMVQHGAQENMAHSDDSIDIFWPDGRITQKHGIVQITEFYKGEVGNRDVG
ncbi:MAG: hypothetical protein QNK30_17330 [Bacteroidales bacterium]|nr:hypothetical protein [Bacteroidales bacterium]